MKGPLDRIAHALQITVAGTQLWVQFLYICRALTCNILIVITVNLVTAATTTTAFVPAPIQHQSYTSHSTFSSLRSSSRNGIQDSREIRAGEDGYSVLRQPANWDVDEDPQFDVPDSLYDDKSNTYQQQQLDEEWWSVSRNNKQQAPLLGRGMGSLPTKESTQPSVQSERFNDRTNNSVSEELNLRQRSLDTLDFPRVLHELYQECSTVPAKRIIQQAMSVAPLSYSNNIDSSSSAAASAAVSLVDQPLIADTVQGSQERYQAVQEMEYLLLGGDASVRFNSADFTYSNRLGYKESLIGRPPPLGGIGFNLQALLAFATTQAKVLEGPELLEVLAILNALQNIQLWNEGLLRANQLDTNTIKFVQLTTIASEISVNATLQELLQTALDENGRLSGVTFPILGRLRARIRTHKTDIMSTLDNLLATPSMRSKLALESGGALYSQVGSSGRLVIPAEPKHAASIGIVHDTSRSGKTVFVEPHEIIGQTNELRQTEAELRTEEARIWRSLTEQILVQRDVLEQSVKAVGQLDLVLARSLLGRKLYGTVPIVREEGVIVLRDAKHPVLILRGIENVVGSDIDLGSGKNQGLVLTGPNAGGKTVILKLLGLLALMARSGIPVPAQSATVSHWDSYHDNIHTKNINDDIHNENDGKNMMYHPRVDFFNPVLADIGDLQSVGGDLSTFSGHMLVCREVLNNSGRNALVLMDELGSGTDPNQGVAIAQALLEAVIETGARVAITTHYIQLKQLATSDDRFSVGGMQFVNGRPTYKLLPGTVGESFALAVAERLGLPQQVLDRANELLDSETRQMGDLICEMEDQKMLMDQQAYELEQKHKEMAAMELKMKEEKIRLEKKQLDARRLEARKFAKLLEEKEAILEDVLEKLKKDPTRRVVAKSWDDIRFVKREALVEAENVPSVVARKQKVAATIEEVSAELVPISEMREKPDLQVGDTLYVCKQGPLFAKEATVTKTMGHRVEVKVNNMTVILKLSQVAMSTGNPIPTEWLDNGMTNESDRLVVKVVSRSKAAERAIAAEGTVKRSGTGTTTVTGIVPSVPSSSSLPTIRTQSNTIDVRGCNLMEAQSKIKDKFSAALLSGRRVVYILHGHGAGGVLKSKLRGWLKTEQQLVQRYGAADMLDGGDAFTRVELR